MDEKTKEELEDLISDWHWDDESYEYASEMGKFLLGFKKYLATLGLSVRNLRHHQENVYLIGMFITKYDYNSPPFKISDIIESSPHTIEYEIKVSDSPTSVANYKATWNYLKKYILSEAYLNFKID